MLTTVNKISRDEWRSLCGLVGSIIPNLKWRHSGLGMLQAYVTEGEADELRVHIWYRTLKKEGIEDSGLLHDHRFDMTSQVLYGAIKQVEYSLNEQPNGAWETHEVVHARAVPENEIGAVTTTAKRYNMELNDVVVRAGESYFFPKRAFHSSSIQSDMVITLITKSKQESFPARILAPAGKPVVHAFADPQPEEQWRHILDDAQRVLLNFFHGKA